MRIGDLVHTAESVYVNEVNEKNKISICRIKISRLKNREQALENSISALSATVAEAQSHSQDGMDHSVFTASLNNEISRMRAELSGVRSELDSENQVLEQHMQQLAQIASEKEQIVLELQHQAAVNEHDYANFSRNAGRYNPSLRMVQNVIAAQQQDIMNAITLLGAAPTSQLGSSGGIYTDRAAEQCFAAGRTGCQ